jgi:hypothetical protein
MATTRIDLTNGKCLSVHGTVDEARSALSGSGFKEFKDLQGRSVWVYPREVVRFVKEPETGRSPESYPRSV